MRTLPKLSRRQQLSAAILALALQPSGAFATNAEFQNFFFSVCSNPTGALAARCGETNGGLGDVSGDSESSLNPSQTLSSNDAALEAAQRRSREIRERLRAKHEVGDNGNEKVDLGPFSLLLNAKSSSAESDKVVDVDAERGYDLDQVGVEVGLDYRMNDTVVMGVLVQWEQSELAFDNENPGANFTPIGEAGEIETDSLGVTAYLAAQLSERAYLDMSLGYNAMDIDSTRNSIFQESNRVIAQTSSVTAGDTEGNELLFTLSAGYQGSAGGWNVTPFVGLTYIDTEIDDYVEADRSGAGLALAVDVDDQSALIGQVGVRLSRVVSMEGWVFVPHARVEYVKELDRDRTETQVSYVNDASANLFNLRGDNLDDDRIDWAAGFSGIFPNGWIPYLEYQAISNAGDLDRSQIVAGLRVEL